MREADARFLVQIRIVPPSASEPYSTAVGPRSTSMRSTVAGSMLASDWLGPLRVVASFKRTPSTTIRIWFPIKPRMIGAPPPRLVSWTNRPLVFANARGNERSPVAASSSAVITWLEIPGAVAVAVERGALMIVSVTSWGTGRGGGGWNMRSDGERRGARKGREVVPNALSGAGFNVR